MPALSPCASEREEVRHAVGAARCSKHLLARTVLPGRARSTGIRAQLLKIVDPKPLLEQRSSGTSASRPCQRTHPTSSAPTPPATTTGASWRRGACGPRPLRSSIARPAAAGKIWAQLRGSLGLSRGRSRPPHRYTQSAFSKPCPGIRSARRSIIRSTGAPPGLGSYPSPTSLAGLGSPTLAIRRRSRGPGSLAPLRELLGWLFRHLCPQIAWEGETHRHSRSLGRMSILQLEFDEN